MLDALGQRVLAEERNCNIFRVGEEEFANRYSASSRSLFKRNGASCVSLSASQTSLGVVSKPSFRDNPAETQDAAHRFEGSSPWLSHSFKSFKIRQRREREEMMQRDLEREQQRQMHRAAVLGVDNAVPTTRKAARQSQHEHDTYIETCGICQDDQPMEVLVPCGHILCSECWQCVKGNSCPFCRRAVEQSVVICTSGRCSASRDHDAGSNQRMAVALPCGHIIDSKRTMLSQVSRTANLAHRRRARYSLSAHVAPHGSPDSTHVVPHRCPDCEAIVAQHVTIFKP